MNWIHRRRFTGVRHFLRSEWNNLVLSTTRRYIADRIVYQSNFARTWWQTVYRKVSAPSTVIYNGVDLQQFHPEGPHQRPETNYRVLLVEGHLGPQTLGKPSEVLQDHDVHFESQGGQPLGQGSALGANDPMMGLLGPVANVVASKTGIPPQVATAVAGIAMHYLLSSHPASGRSGSRASAH